MKPSLSPFSADQHPDLALARSSEPDVASGASTSSMPVPLPAIPREQPPLQPGEIHLMGIVDTVPFYDLNLAGVDPLPTQPYNAPAGNEIHPPTFTGQNYAVPAVRAYDLQGSGIDLTPALQADPQVGDLLSFDQPHGLDIIGGSVNPVNPLAPDAMAPDLSLYDRPDYLEMPGPLAVDPALPNLQHPTLKQEVSMPDRPADLSDAAMTVLHGLPTYEQLPADDYEQLWMTQSGNNQARERHMGMLMLGLDREEGQ